MAAINIISNGLNCIMNAQRTGKTKVEFPTNKLMTGIVDVLLKKNYIISYEKVGEKDKNHLVVNLKYNSEGHGVIYEIKRHSRSARRFYSGYKKIPRVNNGYATMIVSTSKGVMTGKEARESKIGGEVVCHIF